MMIFVFAILVVIAGLIAVAVGNGPAKVSGIVGVVVGALIGLASFVTIVPPGHVGVKVLFGSVQNDTLDEGLHFVNPFMTVYQMSGRTQTYTMQGSGNKSDEGAITTLSSNGLRIPMDVTIVYHLDPQDASWILQNVGYDYVDDLLQPAARTSVRQAAAKFNSEEVYSTKRDELALAMATQLRTNLADVFNKRGYDKEAIHIDQVFLRNVELPAKVTNAIEEKLKADQDQQRMSYVLQKEQKEAERKQIEAEGIQKFQEIVRKGIDEQLLRWKGIEATEELAKSPNSKIIIIGGKDGLPLILNTEAGAPAPVQEQQ